LIILSTLIVILQFNDIGDFIDDVDDDDEIDERIAHKGRQDILLFLFI